MQQFTGIWPALVTPSNPDTSVHIPRTRLLVDYLLDKQVDGFYVGGTTGEGIFMPAAERKKLVETVLEQVDGRVPVIVHVGAVASADAIELTRHAHDHGAAGISSIIPPLYRNLRSISHYYAEVAIAAQNLPFLIYLLNPDFDALTLVQNLLHIPNLRGAKYTGSNMYEFSRIQALGKDNWTMFSGMDEQCVYAAMLGANGCIGSTLNIMPGVYRKIHQHVQAGELAAAHDLQVRANAVITVMIEMGFQGALFAVISHLIGEYVGTVRLPNVPLEDEQLRELQERLDAVGFDELAAL